MENQPTACIFKRSSESKDKVITDYAVKRLIGTGTFGNVYHATFEHKNYAIKILNKSKIIRLNQITHVMEEKEILSNISHPYIVNL